ncbi:MAG TPA: hypothetical protein VKG26_07760 [Bacteroidia bacterium]|nr:hypothetical protein [Bacteroidia bacterium]
MFDNVANTEYMLNVKERIERLKKVHYIVAIILFACTFGFCWWYSSNLSNKLELTKISLSHFGIQHEIGFFWNASLFVIGITLFIEAILNINKYMPKSWLLYLFIGSVICLLLTASVDMRHRIHFYFAYTYFIGYTSSIFLFGFLLMKSDLRMGITSIVISIASVICPLAVLMWIHSFALPELTHTLFVFTWVSITKFDTNYRNFLKRFGL